MDEHKQTTHQDPLINLLFDDGLQKALPRIAEILMNAAMLLEREKHIGAAPYQRGAERNGYANGFKPHNFQTGIGIRELSIPQVRDSDRPFRRSLLENGSRSERALKSASASMYVEGVSTRRVTRIMKQMCGFEVSSGQVSNLNKQLDSEFEKWRTRLLPWMSFMTLDALTTKSVSTELCEIAPRSLPRAFDAPRRSHPVRHARQVKGIFPLTTDFFGWMRRHTNVFRSSNSHSISSPFSICAASANAAGKFT